MLQVPDLPYEPTSTIVLTSRTSHYVDIRVSKFTDNDGTEDELPGEMSSLEWAFAGTSTTSFTPDRSTSHTVWAHWVDSKSADPASDEGDMFPQPDGDVLERGRMTNPQTGLMCEYEELWHDLKINKVGMEKDRVCVVLKADSASLETRGMVIRIGEWCEGIMKRGKDLTVERWQWFPEARSLVEGSDMASKENVPRAQGNGKWERLVRFGAGALPCGMTFLNNLIPNEGGRMEVAKVEWEVVENHRW